MILSVVRLTANGLTLWSRQGPWLPKAPVQIRTCVANASDSSTLALSPGDKEWDDSPLLGHQLPRSCALEAPPSRGGLSRRLIIHCDSECDPEHEHTGLHCDIERHELLDL